MKEDTQRRPVPRTPPVKAIPPARDRVQSRAVVLLCVLAILSLSVFGVLASSELGGRFQVSGVSLLFALAAFALGSATPGGAVCGALVCFCATWWTRDLSQPLLHSDLPPLLALFLITFAATRAGRSRKEARGLAERRGGRTAAQVMANLAVAALAVTPAGAYAAAVAGLTLPVNVLVLATASLAALAEATADTVASEFGQAFGERTVMITSLRRVHRGTDGGVSVAGTAAGIAGALLVVLVGVWSLRLPVSAGAIAFSSATVGLFADSLLGATLERRGWIGNDVVNLLSTAIAALVTLPLSRIIPPVH